MSIHSKDPRFTKVVPLGTYESLVGKSGGVADKPTAPAQSAFSLKWGDLPPPEARPIGRQWRDALADLKPLEKMALDADDLRIAGRTPQYRDARDLFLGTVAEQMPRHYATTVQVVNERGLTGEASLDAAFAILQVLALQPHLKV